MQKPNTTTLKKGHEDRKEITTQALKLPQLTRHDLTPLHVGGDVEDEGVGSQRLLHQRPEEGGNVLVHFQGHAVPTQPVPTGQVAGVHGRVTREESTARIWHYTVEPLLKDTLK